MLVSVDPDLTKKLHWQKILVVVCGLTYFLFVVETISHWYNIFSPSIRHIVTHICRQWVHIGLVSGANWRPDCQWPDYSYSPDGALLLVPVCPDQEKTSPQLQYCPGYHIPILTWPATSLYETTKWSSIWLLRYLSQCLQYCPFLILTSYFETLHLVQRPVRY